MMSKYIFLFLLAASAQCNAMLLPFDSCRVFNDKLCGSRNGVQKKQEVQQQEVDFKIQQADKQDLLSKKIKFSSKEVLDERLRAAFDDQHFVPRTKLGERLGGQEKFPRAVAMMVSTALGEYTEWYTKDMDAKTKQSWIKVLVMCDKQKDIYQAIFKDHPQVFAALEKEEGLPSLAEICATQLLVQGFDDSSEDGSSGGREDENPEPGSSDNASE